MLGLLEINIDPLYSSALEEDIHQHELTYLIFLTVNFNWKKKKSRKQTNNSNSCLQHSATKQSCSRTPSLYSENFTQQQPNFLIHIAVEVISVCTHVMLKKIYLLKPRIPLKSQPQPGAIIQFLHLLNTDRFLAYKSFHFNKLPSTFSFPSFASLRLPSFSPAALLFPSY